MWKTPNHPPPNNSLDKFIDEVSLKGEVRPQDRWIVRQLPTGLKSCVVSTVNTAKNPERSSPLKKKSKNHVSPENFSENITHNINYRRAVEATRAQTELEEVVTVLQGELKESGKKNDGLQHAIDGLNKEIQDLNGLIGDHEIQIKSLQNIL